MSVDLAKTSHRLTIAGPHQVGWEEYPRPHAATLKPNEVLIRSELSAIKHGTESVYYSGEGPFHDSEFDTRETLFAERVNPLYPMPVGNMVVGTVVACGSAVKNRRPSERIYAWAPIADYQVLPAERVSPLGDLTAERALFIDPLIFALGAVRDAGTNVAGKRVAVIGLGSIGLLVAALARRWGATVYAASGFELRRDVARRMGAHHVIDSRATPDLGAAIKKETNGGAEIVFECSGRYPQLGHALRAARKHGTVVTLGFYAGEARGIHLGKEAFHNRLSILFSLPAFRFGNETRDGHTYGDLKDEAVGLLRSGEMNVDGLLRPILPFAQAADVFALLEQKPEQTLKIAVSYKSE